MAMLIALLVGVASLSVYLSPDLLERILFTLSVRQIVPDALKHMSSAKVILLFVAYLSFGIAIGFTLATLAALIFVGCRFLRPPQP